MTAFFVAAATIGAMATAMPATAAPVIRAAGPGSVHMAAPPTATAAGRLTPGGCSGGSGTVACDLFAKPGTSEVGGVSLPIWGFAGTSGGTATAPGPLLVVTQGDSVTITVHNGLSSALSLALPGQALVNGGGGDDLTGAAPGDAKSYTFTAKQPGTFLYEAGHTPDGARQVAMGAAGALVVLPTTAGTSDGNPGGYPDTSYDDDAPLVLSEIDPALNTSSDPLTFDMRNYRPACRLINGAAFPQTNSIATDQGHKVLLRFVNVGQQMHAMSVLGGAQVEVAQDGHPMKYSTTVTAESVDPGMTLDAIVTMPPTAPAGAPKAATKVAIYEANGALDNNAQIAGVVAGQPAQVAFGGMLTFLDTQAPVDNSNDITGPTAKALSVSPNPSDALSDVTVTGLISDAKNSISAAEYVIDDNNPNGDVAPGGGIPMVLSNATATTATATGTIAKTVLAAATFPAGKHIVYVRGLDSAGNWGVVGSVVLNVPKTGPATTNGTATPALTNGSSAIDLSATGDDSAAGGTVTAAEYFVDATSGTATAMTLNRSATVASVDATVPAAAISSEGVHHLWVHVKDSLGLWGPLLDIPVTVDKTGPATMSAGTSPAATNGTVGDPSNPGYVQLSTEVTDQGAFPSKLAAAEAFLGTAPTTASNGKGLQLRPSDGKIDSPDEHFYALIPLSQLKAYKDGKLMIYVHGKDAAGNWGDATVNPATLLIDRVAPSLSGLTNALTAPGSPGVALTSTLTEANTVTSAEYWTTATDPGVGKATSAPVSIVNGKVTVSASFPSAAGNVTFHVRVRDAAGNWSSAVTGVASTFRHNLETATGWSTTTGGVTASANAAQPNPDEPAPGDKFGVQATVALSPAAQRAAYLGDNSPVKDTAYHARFQFAAPTASPLNSGTNASNVVTVFDTRTKDGANQGTEVFAVQFRGTGATAQIRAAVGSAVGAWKTVGTANHTIQVDWVNGAASQLAFSVDGIQQYVVAGGNVTTTIDAAQLGVSNVTVPSTATVGTTGTAWFDTFLSVGS